MTLTRTHTASLIRNPYALADPELAALMERSYNSVPRSHDTPYAAVVAELAGYVTHADQFMMVGYEDYFPKAICYGDLPNSRLFPHPILHVLYNEGSRACARVLREAVLDYLLSAGYTSLMVLNGTGREDRIWLRTMLLPGSKSRPLGSLHLLELDRGVEE